MSVTLTDPDGTVRQSNHQLDLDQTIVVGSSPPVEGEEGCSAPPDDCTESGTDDEDVLQGTPGDDILCGLGGDDILNGGGGNDILRGGDGDDLLGGGRGSDTLEGGNDLDDAMYLGAPAAIRANLQTGSVTGDGTDTLLEVEAVTGGRFPDVIIGDGEANMLNGSAGPDRISAGGGSDQVSGGGAVDNLNGGGADDLLLGGLGENNGDGGSGIDVCYAIIGTKRSCELPRRPQGAGVINGEPVRLAPPAAKQPPTPTASARRGNLVQLADFPRRRIRFGRVCSIFKHGFYERVDKGSTSRDWDDQSEITLSNGVSMARWLNVRPYAVCVFDSWVMRSSRQIASSAPIYPDPDTIGSQAPFYFRNGGNLAYMYYSDGSGTPKFSCYLESFLMPSAGRYWIQMAPLGGGEVDYVAHTQWIKLFPTRSSYVNNRPLYLNKTTDSFTLDD